MSEVDDKEYEELLDLFRENNLTKYGIDRLYGAIIDREIKSRLEIERLNNIINELNDKIEDDKMIIEGNWGCINNLKKDYILQKNIIKEVRELVENGIDFKSIHFRKVDEDTWKLILASNIKEDLLDILDKVGGTDVKDKR